MSIHQIENAGELGKELAIKLVEEYKDVDTAIGVLLAALAMSCGVQEVDEISAENEHSKVTFAIEYKN